MTKIKHPATRAERIEIAKRKKELHRRKGKAKEPTDEATT